MKRFKSDDHSDFRIETEKSSFSEEKFLLYRKYQTAVHLDAFDEVTPESFSRFLVTSPLVDCDPRFGTFHQTYFLGDRLVAVAVGIVVVVVIVLVVIC
jgi:arginyl-tRNA--protein-N-Asp/Glu arginylyltransferase